jgi:hypothetical protein
MAQKTVEQQLKESKLDAARLREALRKAKAGAKRAQGSAAPSFPGAHRGY